MAQSKYDLSGSCFETMVNWTTLDASAPVAKIGTKRLVLHSNSFDVTYYQYSVIIRCYILAVSVLTLHTRNAIVSSCTIAGTRNYIILCLETALETCLIFTQQFKVSQLYPGLNSKVPKRKKTLVFSRRLTIGLTGTLSMEPPSQFDKLSNGVWGIQIGPL